MLLILEKKIKKKIVKKFSPKKNLQKMASADIRQGERRYKTGGAPI